MTFQIQSPAPRQSYLGEPFYQVMIPQRIPRSFTINSPDDEKPFKSMCIICHKPLPMIASLLTDKCVCSFACHRIAMITLKK